MTLPITPALATDCVVFDPIGRVLVIRRKHEPCAGSHALPGGFVKVGETVEAACRREVLEETGIEVSELVLVGVYSDVNRDPRGHIVSVAYTTILPASDAPTAGPDSMSAEWLNSGEIILGFDHSHMLADAKTKFANSAGDPVLDFNEGGG
jgi:8-oxo-dGTP diphosphatase